MPAKRVFTTVAPMGAGGDDRIFDVVYTDGTTYSVRGQVLADLSRARPTWGTWYPHLCPTCFLAGCLHAFDFVVQLVDLTKLVQCCNCGLETTLANSGRVSG